MGSLTRATPPAIVITIDNTDAKIGRSIKNREIMTATIENRGADI
jgi:hypothetical protein